MMAGIQVRLPKPGTVLEHLRARLESPTITQELVGEILGAAGLGPPTSVRNVAVGWRTSVVVADTGESRYVVRRYPDRWSDSAIVHEHALLLELAARDFPAPRLVSLEGGSYLRKIEGARFSVQAFEAGRSLAGFHVSRKQMRRLQELIGRVLAEFHHTLSGFVPAGRHHLGIDPVSGRQQRDLNWHLEVIDQLEAGRDDTSVLSSEAGEIASLRSRLIELERLIEESDLPSALVHGDYGLHNIIFRPSGEAVVHDLELSRLDIRLIDLAASLSRIQPQFRHAFLEGMVEAGGVEASELDMLETVWEWYRIRGAVQSAEAFSRFGGEHRRAAVGRRLAEAGKIRSGREMVPK